MNEQRWMVGSIGGAVVVLIAFFTYWLVADPLNPEAATTASATRPTTLRVVESRKPEPVKFVNAGGKELAREAMSDFAPGEFTAVPEIGLYKGEKHIRGLAATIQVEVKIDGDSLVSYSLCTSGMPFDLPYFRLKSICPDLAYEISQRTNPEGDIDYRGKFQGWDIRITQSEKDKTREIYVMPAR